MAGADELPVATTILGAPARYFVPAVAVGLGFALGVSLVAGIVLGILLPGGLILLHRKDPSAFEIWVARMRLPWWRAWTIGRRRRPVIWSD
ncbi:MULTISPECIES: hypothetical protein [Tistrella]|nr:hypothetical protein [Tistrella sp.]